ncbi:DUF1672 family protein [Alkalicoccobacillus porphyridii]|uniref:DUF1672 family protein n=1 Tax=Alkalicoccobacillus porphyridii TaxID=2597270 RepID=UPI00163DA3F9|nr:DUF1672 family protein [Alkalicoccobacillus porphyridii]
MTTNPSTDDHEENPPANGEGENPPDNQPSGANDSDPYIPIQEYTGEGYELDGGELTQPIANENLPEIEEAVKKFFIDEYKTEVIVHNVVGAREAATVFVESVGEPHFYSFAVVPIDLANENVLLEEVFSENGQVEMAIVTGVYAMIYKEEMKNIDDYLSDIAIEYPVTGMSVEAIENVGGSGFATEYYYLSGLEKAFDGIVEKYKENPERSRDEWEELYPKDELDPENIFFTIRLHMDQENVDVDEELFEKLEKDIESIDNVPPGRYSIFLYDNNIDPRNLQGSRTNVMERAVPNEIIKP